MDNEGDRGNSERHRHWQRQFVSFIEHAKRQAHQQRAEKKHTAAIDRAVKGTAWATWIIAIAGAIALALGVLQYFVLRGQLDVMAADQRAWVAPSQLVLDGTQTTDSLKVLLRLENVGKTPALHVTWSKFRVFLAPYIQDSNAAAPSMMGRNDTCDGLSPSNLLVLWPSAGQKFWYPTDLSTGLEAFSAIKAATKRKGSLIVEGCIAYLTGGKPHTSAFRFLWRDTPALPSEWQFNVTPEGNDAN